MNNFQLRQILLEIQSNLKCMKCGKAYTAENIHLRGAFKNMFLFQLACADHAAFATITVVGQSSERTEIKLTVDDCIGFHNELEQFEGDFTKIFNSK